MAVEGERLVLGDHENAAQVGVHAVGKGDVDNAIDAAERHGRLGTITREREKTLARPSGQETNQRIVNHDLRRSSSRQLAALKVSAILPQIENVSILEDRPAIHSATVASPLPDRIHPLQLAPKFPCLWRSIIL